MIKGIIKKYILIHRSSTACEGFLCAIGSVNSSGGDGGASGYYEKNN